MLRKGDVLVVPSSAIKHDPGFSLEESQLVNLRLARLADCGSKRATPRRCWTVGSGVGLGLLTGCHPDGGLETGKAPANETAHISGMELQR